MPSRSRGSSWAIRRVAAEAHSPVVVVPPEAAADPQLDALADAPIVCGVDGSQEGNGAVAVAARLAASTKGNLVLANVSEQGEAETTLREPVDLSARLTGGVRTRLNLLHRSYDARS